MVGEKIKQLRIKNSLTQKDMAEKLFVTAQAVSRWENNEVEPSISTLSEMAKIFNVSISELVGEEEVALTEVKEPIEQQIVQEKPKVVLAICEHCNKPIYEGSKIVRKTEYIGNTLEKKILCRDCDKKIKEDKLRYDINHGINQRRKSFIWGGIFSGLITLVSFLITYSTGDSAKDIILATLCGATFFPFLSCLYLQNNFVVDVFASIASWSIRFPGLIFTLDWDGISWLIAMKILFAIISAVISVLCFLLALSVSLWLSLVVYPFALVKSIRHPELTE